VCVLCESATLFVGPQQGAIAQTSSLNGAYIARRVYVCVLCESAILFLGPQQGAIAQTSSLNGEYIARRENV
jgi:hypothetical protein